MGGEEGKSRLLVLGKKEKYSAKENEKKRGKCFNSPKRDLLSHLKVKKGKKLSPLRRPPFS